MTHVSGLTRRALAVVLAAALLPAAPRGGAASMIPADLDARTVAASGEAGRPLAAAAPSDELGRPLAAAAALEGAGLSATEARARALSLDAVETARLRETDLSQRGGDGLVLVLAVVGIVAIVLWLADEI
jgi:hypothetical protein